MRLCNLKLWNEGTMHCVVPRDKVWAWGLKLHNVYFRKDEWGYVSQEVTFLDLAKCGISKAKVNKDKTWEWSYTYN